MEDFICAQCGQKTNVLTCPHCQSSALLNNRYRLHELIGQGAAGSTYRSWDSNQEQWVALKELPWRLGDEQRRKQRLLQEATILQQIDHPQTPRYIDHFFLKEGRHRSLCIVQEFIAGPTLLEAVDRRRFSQKEVWELAESLLQVLCYLHELSPPLIHRDIKPSNIILAQPAPVLIDFGAVRDALIDRSINSSIFAGTFGYMAPEQLQGEATPQTDLYSLGALLIRVLTRQEPSQLSDHQLHIHWQPVLSLSPGFTRFLNKLIHPNPQHRWSSTRHALSALRTAINPPIETIQTPAPHELMQTIRTVIQDEFQQEYLRKQQDDAPIPHHAATEHTGQKHAPLTLDPLSPTHIRPANDPEPLQLLTPRQRKGWWEARPPMPPEKRQQPTHPATQLVFMAGLFFVITLLIQIII